jgi:hypothetical protein
MATAELHRAPELARARVPHALRTRPRVSAADSLLAALLLIALWAASEGGSSTMPSETRVQVAIALLASLAGAAWLWGTEIRLAAPRMAWIGLGLLAAFALSTGVTVLWSIAPDATWTELNRVLAYTVVLGLALAAGASVKHPVRKTADGVLLAVLLMTAYALGQKVVPGLHIPELFDLNQTPVTGPRLSNPLGYSNALALFIAFGVPLALVRAVDRERSDRARLVALLSLPLMFLAIGLTYSRGGLLAVVIGIAVGMALGGSKLRSLAVIAIAAVAMYPMLLFGTGDPSLSGLFVPLGTREVAGLELAVAIVVCLAALWWVGRRLLARERSSTWSRERIHGVGRLLVVAAALAVVVGFIAVAVSHRGVGGTASHVWHNFTSVSATSVFEPGRLASASSGNRWAWWQEAGGAFSARPIGGWGAGSFSVLDLLYRRNGSVGQVLQPHNLPMQWLAETGLVGASLGIAALAALLAGAVLTVRRLAPGPDRMLAAALLAGGLAFALHTLYDWDWDIPGVTLPALVMLGVLSGSRAPGLRRDPRVPVAGPGLRATGVALLTVLMCLYCVSAVLPSLAQSDARKALVVAAGGTSRDRQQAMALAKKATKLNPFSDAGLTAAATISVQAGRLAQARDYLFDAVRRNPDDVAAWEQLASLEAQGGDLAGLRVAAARALALDPKGAGAIAIAVHALALSSPPSDSATATGTPLPAY